MLKPRTPARADGEIMKTSQLNRATCTMLALICWLGVANAQTNTLQLPIKAGQFAGTME
jgi:hypothetical protein